MSEITRRYMSIDLFPMSFLVGLPFDGVSVRLCLQAAAEGALGPAAGSGHLGAAAAASGTAAAKARRTAAHRRPPPGRAAVAATSDGGVSSAPSGGGQKCAYGGGLSLGVRWSGPKANQVRKLC